MLDVIKAIRERTVALDLARERGILSLEPMGCHQPNNDSTSTTTTTVTSSNGSSSSTMASSSSGSSSGPSSSSSSSSSAADDGKRPPTLPKPTAADLAKAAGKGLAVALSLGELPSEVYQAFYDAGAHRYLLRIETSDPELYAKLHPR